MPRPKRQTIYRPPGVALAEARLALQPSIEGLLSAASRGRRPAAVPASVLANPNYDPHFDVEAHLELLAMIEGRPFTFRHWKRWQVFALVNVASNIRSGDYHLHPCRQCENWMLVQPKNRAFCPTCRKARHAKREAKRQRVEVEAQKSALGRVTRQRASRTFS